MLGTINIAFTVLEITGTFIALALTVIGIYATGFYLVKGRKVQAEDALAQSAVTSLTGEVTALTSKNLRLEKDIEHEKELRLKQDQVIEQQNQRIKNLEDIVTARDLITDLDTVIRAGFTELGVENGKLPLIATARPGWQ